MRLQNISVITNGEKEDHFRSINRLLDTTRSFDCVVAFARMSGFGRIKSKIESRLKEGMRARFFVGLSLYQSEPDLLDGLLHLKEKFSIEVFVSNPKHSRTFHPKIYRFDQGHQVSVIIGSANLTAGGFSQNHEISAHLQRAEERQVANFLQQLIDDRDVVELDCKILGEYRERYEINKLTESLAKKRSARLRKKNNVGLAYLQEFLVEMKAGDAESEFSKEMRVRKKNRLEARCVLEEVKNAKTFSAASFDRAYSRLAGELWRSGGLLRQKSRIAKEHQLFQSLCASAISFTGGTSVARAYGLMQAQAVEIVGIGPNIITEMLNTRDNKRFAVMNQNSVSGLRTAGYTEFPERPNKQVVDGKLFAQFCRAADDVRGRLKLRDLSELDALLSYVYFNHQDDPD